MNKLLLTIPDQFHNNTDSVVETDPTRVEDWFASLPTERISETVHQLDHAITLLNETTLTDSKRANLLKIYHNGFDHVLQGYMAEQSYKLKLHNIERKTVKHAICPVDRMDRQAA